MTQIFIFTAGQSAARAHLDDSIISPVDLSKLEGTFLESTGEQDNLMNRKELENFVGDKNIFCWGSMPTEKNYNTWSRMNIGDYVICVYENRYRFISRLKKRLNSFDLAKYIWGLDDGKTWQYMYFLTEPIPIDFHLNEISMGDSPIKGFRGFARISDERIDFVKDKFGSLDQFIKDNFKIFITPEKSGIFDLDSFRDKIKDEELFVVNDIEDARKKINTSICRRQGQRKFREKVLNAYGRKCAITNCSISATLEAAHIIPYKGSATNHIKNGILLRADIHTLFDLDLLKIDENYSIHIDKSIDDKEYMKLDGKSIRLPINTDYVPSKEALTQRFKYKKYKFVKKKDILFLGLSSPVTITHFFYYLFEIIDSDNWNILLI